MTRTMLVITLLSIGFAGAAQALTLEWDRNAEPDMKDYLIWVCTTPGCTVAKSRATFKARVPQSPPGKAPAWVLPDDLAGKPGAVAISARDLSGNDSGLSVQLSFDTTAPTVPANPRLK